jgi:DNA-binding transcriptional ArsR family regulator
MLRAFSDPTRLRILHLVQDTEMCVGDIVRAVVVRATRIAAVLMPVTTSSTAPRLAPVI